MIQNIICKDTFYTFSEDDIRFRLVVDGDVIYEGRSKAKPDGVNKINVNRICANYLELTMEGIDLTVLQAVVHPKAYRVFTLQKLSSDTWTTVETFGFLWCYDMTANINFSSANTLSNPIDNQYMTGMYSYTTVFNNGQVVTTPSATTNNACGEYALIYRNLRGGYDSFLFEGKCRRTDNFSLSQMKKDYDNTQNEFGKYTYLNQVTGRWELSTGFLSDDECEKFARNLASSTEQYLVDFKNSVIIPVVGLDTQVNYKTYKNDGQDAPIYLTYNVESSQNNNIY